jgi:hypothetical protein
MRKAFMRERGSYIFLGICLLIPLFKLWTWIQNDFVQEATVRHLLSNGPNPNLQALFIQIHGRDPSSAFLQRFENESLSVLGQSQSQFVPDPRMPPGLRPPAGKWVSASTGKNGWRCSLDNIHWFGPFAATIEVNGEGAGTVYTLLWVGSWRVVHKKMSWIE